MIDHAFLFETLVEQALSELPPQFKDLLHNIAIVVEEEPTDEDLDVLGGRLYAKHNGGEILVIYDLADPTSPARLGGYTPPDNLFVSGADARMAIASDRAYLAHETACRNVNLLHLSSRKALESALLAVRQRPVPGQPRHVRPSHEPIRHAPRVPSVWTLGGNMAPGQVADSRAICVSQNHARRHGTRAFVLNGVRVSEYEFRSEKGDYDLFLARLHRVKGWRRATAVAKQLRIRLVLAGGWRPSLSHHVRFVGRVGGARKRELLAGARCLWMPVEWEDPCPNNVLEALASGTPVIASLRGALPELLSPDTGGLGSSLDELVALRGRLADWEPKACQTRAARYFSHIRMARDYLRMYEGMLADGRLPEGRRPDASD